MINTEGNAIVDGREVEVIPLSNGEKIYMHAKIAGLQYRKLLSFTAKIVDINANVNLETKETDKPTISLDLSDYYEELIVLFPYLCAGILTTTGNVIAATIAYYDKLVLQDAITVMTVLENIVNPYLGRGGNIAGSAAMDDEQKKS